MAREQDGLLFFLLLPLFFAKDLLIFRAGCIPRPNTSDAALLPPGRPSEDVVLRRSCYGPMIFCIRIFGLFGLESIVWS
jgi:hypothetical protein